jgi:hypothetical protein
MAVFKNKNDNSPGNVWARPEMLVTFRAEIMPGLSREKRTFKVKAVTPIGRVTLYDFKDEHGENEFEPLTFSKPRA